MPGMHLQKSTIFVFAKEKPDDPIATREMKFKHPESAVIAHGLKSLVREHINTLLSASDGSFPYKSISRLGVSPGCT